MLQAAHVDVSWRRGPAADDILARDRERLAGEIGALTAEVSDDDRTVARTLLAGAPAEDLVAALVRIRREARPAPEELTLPPSMRPRREPEPRRQARPEPRREARPARPEQRPRQLGPRNHGESPRDHGDSPRGESRDHAGGAWFTINVGRSKNADPKWLLPLLCRRGNITKREIGKIQILMRETRVEIAPEAAAGFAEAIRRPDPKDRNIHIEPLDPEL
jgi:ATP-dependent RNA helicase DeaD